VAMWG